MLRPLGRPRSNGSCRFLCPAAAGLVRCPLKPDSLTLPYTRRTVYPSLELTARPPKVCTQTTITVPASVQASTRQPHPWGSRAWYDAYERHRAAVASI